MPVGFFGEDARRLFVDGVGKIALALGAVNGGVGGGVENDIGRGAANQLTGFFGIGQVDGFAVDADDGAVAGEDLLELAAELSGVADDEDSGIGGRGGRFAHADKLRRSWKCAAGILNGCREIAGSPGIAIHRTIYM